MEYDGQKKLPRPTSSQLIEYFDFQYGDEFTNKQFHFLFIALIDEQIETKNNQTTNDTNIKTLTEQNTTKLEQGENKNQIKNNNKKQDSKDTNSNFSFQQQPITRREPYPTKNFLVHFKKAHLNFLQQNCVHDQETIKIANKLKNKNGISMKDYQQIYKIQNLNMVFQKLFKRKILYRNVMNSRLNLKQKLIYLSRISIFQESFRAKKFDHIN